MVNEALQPVEVAGRLRPVLLKLGRELRREVHPLGVTGGQVALLVQIRSHPGIGVRELAALERISPAGMSGHVKRLERAGLVERAAHASDLRRQGLTVTEAGERVLRSVRSRRTAWLSARLRQLEPDELAAVDRALPPLARLLEPGE
jgi:DNA-binding MarR family transcriptional regulator